MRKYPIQSLSSLHRKEYIGSTSSRREKSRFWATINQSESNSFSLRRVSRTDSNDRLQGNASFACTNQERDITPGGTAYKLNHPKATPKKLARDVQHSYRTAAARPSHLIICGPWQPLAYLKLLSRSADHLFLNFLLWQISVDTFLFLL